MKQFHVDVFSQTPFGGNGLTVVFPDRNLSQKEMQQIALEFKQFETIFLTPVSVKEKAVFQARIFTVEEELDFAGHPILGAVAVIHAHFFAEEAEKEITLQLNAKTVLVQSKKENEKEKGVYSVIMNQGVAVWGREVSAKWREKYCEILHLKQEELCDQYPMEIVSTGLPYLLVPIQRGLEHVQIQGTDLEALLAENGAKFAYVFDVNKLEGRTWDNLGAVEDVATGSAAGPVGAYLYKHDVFLKNQEILLHQGSFVNRPSVIRISCKEDTEEILVAGAVVLVASGEILL